MEFVVIKREIEAWKEAVWEREVALDIARQELARWEAQEDAWT